MTRPDEIAADLPAPRDDEPTSLRADIVDELADHLQCALNRELHSPASGGRQAADSDPATAARRRVLFRFGNPSTIARRLWYDAMKEKIMSQRISTGAAVVAAVACVGMFVFMWQSTAANRAMLEQSQQLNSQLLEQMQGLAAAMSSRGTEEEAPAEWNRLQILCVTETEDGPPMEGVSIRLQSGSENTVGIPPTTLTSDAKGLVDFGRVLYGQYTVELTAPNGMELHEEISVRPGHDTLQAIACPSGNGLTEVRIEPDIRGANEPEALRGRIWYRFAVMRIEFSAGDWSRPTQIGRHPDILNWFVAPDGRLIEIDEPEPEATVSAGVLAGVTHAIWKLPDHADLQETRLVEPGWYEVGIAAVCVVDDKDTTGRTLQEILVVDRSGRSGSFSSTPDESSVKVVSGRRNELSIPVPTETFAMLERVLESAPGMEVATLWVGSPIADSFAHQPGSPRKNSPAFGSRVALYRNSFFGGFGGSGAVRPAQKPLLMGVEVISYRDVSRYGNRSGGRHRYELRVLLTPEERALLESLNRPVYASVEDPTTERTSLDPAVKVELEERYGSAAAESPPTEE